MQMLGTPGLRLLVALVLGGTALCANKTSSGPVSVAQWHSGTVARRSGTLAPWHGEVAQWHGVVLK